MIWSWGTGTVLAADGPTNQQLEFFEKRIRPVLVKHCYACHSEQKSAEVEGELRVDLRAGLHQGGLSGPAVVPGKPEESVLISAMEYRNFEMPPSGKLPGNVVDDFRKWIKMGAPDPRDGEMSASAADRSDYKSSTVELWSLAPISPAQKPQVKNDRWPRAAIDVFVLAQLEKSGLEPVGDAEPLALLRRLSFDLKGLPPSIVEQDRFVKAYQTRPREAVREFVNEMLASPRFGERWARHWMDVVRYGESEGNSRDVLRPEAWRYRNYLIDAFNADVPFDRFVTEQIAGDLLPADSSEERDRLRIATGLLAIGSKSLNGGNLPLDIADDQIDVVGKSILGLTVSCARCHDHKFDPIPTADYYALAGIFQSTDTLYGGGTRRPKNDVEKVQDLLVLGTNPQQQMQALKDHDQQIKKLTKRRTTLGKRVKNLESKLPKNWDDRRQEMLATLEDIESSATENAPLDDPRKQLAEADRKFLTQVETYETARQELQQTARELREIEEQDSPSLEFAMGVRDAKKIADFPIQIRGERTQRGQVVPRGFLSCVELKAQTDIPAESSGRLELARWLTRPDHPLTSRVIVNRVWQHLFGRGLVETVDNFGVNGTKPSHPELLDDLAYRFVHEHGWSIKSLIRDLVSSRTYQLASDYDARNMAADPANLLYWRMSRRRLEAEPLRDAMLSLSGEMRLERPEASLVTQIGEGEVGRGINTSVLEEPFPYRSVYLPIIRGLIPEPLKLFDFPEPSNPQGVRDTTNVPAQSLYLMNSPFVLRQADVFAESLLKSVAEPQERIRTAYRLCFTREPTSQEIERSLEYLRAMQPKANQNAGDKKEDKQIAWSSFVQALWAGAEFRFVN